MHSNEADPISSSQVQKLRLADGRELAWYEYGNPDGVPCLYVTGTPASGVIGALYDRAATQAGVRWISVDKPGYGFSDFQPNRSLLDWPKDVEALIRHLGIQRFATVGESGGGPYALVTAYAMPARITLAVCLAGMGPGHESWVREGMKPMNRRLFWLAQRAPWLLRWAMGSMARTLDKPAAREKWLANQLKVAPPSDVEIMRSIPGMLEQTMTAFRLAMRDGGRGAAQEMAMFGRPWGFELSAIRAPVEIWHGTADVNVPIAVAREVAKRIPRSKTRIFEGSGHALVREADALMEAIRAAAAAPA